jgi:hypothetical protein
MKESHVVAMKQAPLKAQKPTEEEVEVAEVFVLSPPPELDSLPQTASPTFAFLSVKKRHRTGSRSIIVV